MIVNGIYLEKTPMTLQATLEGVHEIQIELPGHETWRRRFKVQPGKGIEATLVPRR